MLPTNAFDIAPHNPVNAPQPCRQPARPRLSACNGVAQLVDKSQGLNANARAFQKQSAGLKNALWWKNCRIVLSLLCVIFLLALGILVLKCGWTLQSCQRLTEG